MHKELLESIITVQVQSLKTKFWTLEVCYIKFHETDYLCK